MLTMIEILGKREKHNPDTLFPENPVFSNCHVLADTLFVTSRRVSTITTGTCMWAPACILLHPAFEPRGAIIGSQKKKCSHGGVRAIVALAQQTGNPNLRGSRKSSYDPDLWSPQGRHTTRERVLASLSPEYDWGSSNSGRAFKSDGVELGFSCICTT